MSLFIFSLDVEPEVALMRAAETIIEQRVLGKQVHVEVVRDRKMSGADASYRVARHYNNTFVLLAEQLRDFPCSIRALADNHNVDDE